jgi:hypothetical protein
MSDQFRLICKQLVEFNNDMLVYHDDINNVTCYVYHGGTGVAMSCIPDKQLE